MSGRAPTAAQVDLLTQVEAGRVAMHGGRGGAWSYMVGDRTQTATVERLSGRGWIEAAEEYWGVATVAQMRLTPAGRQVLADERDRIEYAAIPAEDRPRVSITKRPRGRSPIRGMPNPGAGRNVNCWNCAATTRAAGNPRGPIVWFTNETGAAAQQAAEVALRRHVLAHARGQL